MNLRYNYLFLVSDYMADCTMCEFEELNIAKKVNKSRLSENKLFDLFLRFYLSIGANKVFSLPFKSAIYKSLLSDKFQENKPICIVISPPWYDKRLIKFLRKRYDGCKLIIHFNDTVKQALQSNRHLTLDIIKNDFDAAIVYNPDDAKKYGFLLHSVGYSVFPEDKLQEFPKCDIVFIGAAKNRLPLIRKLYEKFTQSGLDCYFYVTEAPKTERIKDGIIYGDKNLPFKEYLAREASAKALLEIVQGGSKGKTYRTIEALAYNKMLITNCPEIKDTPYYNKDFVLYFEDEDDISVDFIKNHMENIDYNYNGDFSQKNFIEFMDNFLK